MGKNALFTGSCTALITPFTEHGIDYERLEKNIRYQYENGTSAVVVCGTTGEAATLSQGEHDELVRKAVIFADRKMKVIVGIGGNNTENALHNAENARFAGADGILMVTPFYNKSSPQGIIEHFCYVADRVDIPMIVYNVPSRTGVHLTADICLELSKHPNINGIKEASGDISLAGKIRALCGDELNIWSGNDDITLPIMSLGGKGVISVASNIVPAAVAKLCELCLTGDFKAGAELSARYSRLFTGLFIETNPIPIKAAMELMNMDSGILRLPLVPITAEHRTKLIADMTASGIAI